MEEMFLGYPCALQFFNVKNHVNIFSNKSVN